MQPEITVVTPTLPGRADLLAEAMASVEAQTLPAAAHLISVDLHRQGPGPVLNQLVSASKTEWVSILADDDLYDPNYLEVMGSQEADIVLSWCRIEGRDDAQYRGKFSTFDLVQRKDTGMRGTFMFRKSLWEKLGGFAAGPCEDWEFLCRAAVERAVFTPVYKELWTYRFHGGNVSEIQAALARGEEPAELHYLKHYL